MPAGRMAPAPAWAAHPIRRDVPAERVVGAEFSSHMLDSGLVWVGVRGEVDIRNSRALALFSRARAEESRGLILDLSAVEFFGAAGLEVFDDLDEGTRRHGARWALVCGRPVQRLLRVTDYGLRFPTHVSVEVAASSIDQVA